MCGVFSPQFGQTQEPPGPAAMGPPILSRPPPWPLPWPRPWPPRPEPIPKPLGMTFPPCCRRHPWQPGIMKARFASSPFRKALNRSSTVPQVKLITRTPPKTSLASIGAEIAPQMRRPAPKLKNSATRASGSVRSSGLSSRRISCPFSTSISSRLPATSNTGETRPCHCGIAILITVTQSTRRAGTAKLFWQQAVWALLWNAGRAICTSGRHVPCRVQQCKLH